MADDFKCATIREIGVTDSKLFQHFDGQLRKIDLSVSFPCQRVLIVPCFVPQYLFAEAIKGSAGILLHRANEVSCIHLPSRPQRRVIRFSSPFATKTVCIMRFGKRAEKFLKKFFRKNPCAAPPVSSLRLRGIEAGGDRQPTQNPRKRQKAPVCKTQTGTEEV